ncbi:hypothetical protein BJV78DRAFT_590574 [Lactifluus subvellereus]|nr:hypothetical protein BJV78DRAFT_590574 [Lactifluus subvellereus]
MSGGSDRVTGYDGLRDDPFYLGSYPVIPLFSLGEHNIQQPGSVYTDLPPTPYPGLPPGLPGGSSYRVSPIGGQTVVYQGPDFFRLPFRTPCYPGNHINGPSSWTYPQSPDIFPQLMPPIDPYPQVPLLISGCPPYDLREGQYRGVSPAFTGRPDTLAVPVPMVSPISYNQPLYAAPEPFQDGVSDTAPKGTEPSWCCPVSGCSAPFGRPQERRRHVVSHLPHCFYCRVPGCSWRGDRVAAFLRHRKDHPSSSQAPDKDEFTIYDPLPLVDDVIEGSKTIGEAQRIAESMVRSKAQEFGKSEIWGNAWGRRRRREKQRVRRTRGDHY